ncbi:1-(5-phosphoribosyl)-5-((5- phosphoribosylamino)methylideneamino) imidazole-4-carboxamide isomerase [Thermodesulfobium narugense DSM 14796]|uniref:1-(5-phosphoribosyl)-5-[(5-phosphoribosylamino)methylideneamino] imidazole-4-carboxamide isomerase n=1 Tax=Thermodesulfobium narugense DSM 14796 TaxID=747365 RepID=M1E5G5_9BACT|nr:HisA/HisF-related TIM barrel protein [Thermodesulfobium narugense]AEE14256.1 1-(5-phosphoribosyl)-5-((5- phosphoribosylamino)methylideneamino) imidazole-4-carboxamide isomerase [Thermodesulfobium narugense DSM 14796]
MFEIIPAIDIYRDNVVRLYQGDFDKIKIYGKPEDYFNKLKSSGINFVHIIDLEASKIGQFTAFNVLEMAKSKGFVVQWGGGVRKYDDVKVLAKVGADRIIIGTVAFTDEETLNAILKDFGDKILISLDFKDSKLCFHGWTTSISLELKELQRKFGNRSNLGFLVTDINRDGTLSSPSVELFENIRKIFPKHRLIGAGGISKKEHINILEEVGFDGAVIGKAWMEGHIKFFDGKVI